MTDINFSNTKILVVDDEPLNQEIIREILDDEFEIMTVGSGEECLEMIDSFRPNVVLLDIMMKGIDGYEVCDRIRQEKDNALVKVILVSGRAMLEDRLKGYEVGADDFIVKPFIDDELIAKTKVFARLERAERQLQDLNLNLEQKIMEQSQKLFEQEKMAFLGMHVAETVHNLKNPLAIIKGHAEILCRKTPDIKQGPKIVKGCERITEIIGTVLNRTRPSLSHHSDVVDLNQILKEQIEICQSVDFVKKNIQVKTEFGDIEKLNGNSVHFCQIFGNLVINACHAMYDSPKKDLRIGTSMTDKEVIIEIEDSGSGIDEKNLDKIFETFYTTKNSTTVKGMPIGTGLGLPSAKKMIESYMGRIDVTSKVSIGTIVSVAFPKSSSLEQKVELAV